MVERISESIESFAASDDKVIRRVEVFKQGFLDPTEYEHCISSISKTAQYMQKLSIDPNKQQIERSAEATSADLRAKLKGLR